MSNIEEKEIWEFQRKSFVHWRKPFLPDDPPPFVSRDKQKLNNINQYKLNPTYTWYQPKENNNNHNKNEWMIQIVDNITTDSQGWIYSDHFQSRKWSKNQFSSSHLCRKRRWKRKAKKQFVSKITKVHSTPSLGLVNEGLYHNSYSYFFFFKYVHQSKYTQITYKKPKQHQTQKGNLMKRIKSRLHREDHNVNI